MVDARDQRGKRDAQKIAEKGHQRLKATEPDADGECLFHTAAAYGQADTAKASIDRPTARRNNSSKLMIKISIVKDEISGKIEK